METFTKNSNEITFTHQSNDVDYDLIYQCQLGNTESFKTLINNYKEKVRNMIYSFTHNLTAVEDITQDVFVKIYYSLNKFSFKSKFSTWLYKITLNKCRDYLRRKKILSFFIPLDENVYSADFTDTLEKKETIQIIRQSINKLSSKLKEVIILRDIEQLNYEEISTILNCNEGTVKSRLFRAREKLKYYLGPYKNDIGL